jgi:O-antigen ligase
LATQRFSNRLGGVFFWAAAVALAAMPAAYLPLTQDYTYVKTFLIQSAALLAALGVLAAPARRRFTLLDGVVLAWVAWTAASRLWARHPWATADSISFELTCALLYVALSLQVRTARREAAFLGLLGAGCVLAAALSGLRVPGHDRLIPFGNPNLAGNFLILPTCVALAVLIRRLRDRRPAGGTAAAAVVFAVCALALANVVVGHGSRGPAAGAAAGQVTVCVLAIAGRRRRLGLGLVVAAGVVTALLLLPAARENVRREPGTSTASLRVALWRSAVGILAKRPLVGAGAGTFHVEIPLHKLPAYHAHLRARPGTMHAHSTFLETACNLGVAGLGIFVALLAGVLLTLCPRGRPAAAPDAVAAGLAAGLLGVLCHAAVSVAFEWPACRVALWVAAALAVRRAAPPVPARGRIVLLAGALPLGALFYLGAVQPLRAQVLLHGAHEQARAGDRYAALRLFRQAVTAGHDGVTAMRARYWGARVAADAGMPRQAEAAYRALDRKAPGILNVRRNLIRLLLRWGKLPDAARLARAELARNPYDWHLYDVLFQVTPPRGRARYRSMLEHAVDRRPWDFHLVYLLAGAEAAAGRPEARARYERCAALCREHIGRFPQDRDAWLWLARALAALDPEEALKVLRKARPRWPRAREINDLIAILEGMERRKP